MQPLPCRRPQSIDCPRRRGRDQRQGQDERHQANQVRQPKSRFKANHPAQFRNKFITQNRQISQRAQPCQTRKACKTAINPNQIPVSRRQGIRRLAADQCLTSGPTANVNMNSRKLLSAMARHKRISGSQSKRPYQNGSANKRASTATNK